MTTALEREVSANFSAFKAGMEKDLLVRAAGKFALLRKKKLVRVFDTSRDALTAGELAYSDGIYSVQKIGQAAVNVGGFAFAVPLA